MYFDDAARKRSYLVFVLQCSKLFAPETLKESSTSQQNFFWSCSLSLSLPLCSVDMQKWTILTGKITFWRRKNWIRKRKNKIQNCKWKKRQLENGLLSSTKLYMLHDVRNGQRTIEGNRLLFIKRNAKLYIKLQSKNLFWKRIKTYERRTKNRRLLSQTYEIEVAFKVIYRLQLIVTYDPNMQHFHKKGGQ